MIKVIQQLEKHKIVIVRKRFSPGEISVSGFVVNVKSVLGEKTSRTRQSGHKSTRLNYRRNIHPGHCFQAEFEIGGFLCFSLK